MSSWSHPLRLNFLAKIGLLWYEINDISNAKKPTVLRTVPRLKLIGTDHFGLAKTKPAVFYRQIRHAELFDITRIPGSDREQRIMCNTLGLRHKSRQERTEVAKMVRNFENSLLISLF